MSKTLLKPSPLRTNVHFEVFLSQNYFPENIERGPFSLQWPNSVVYHLNYQEFFSPIVFHLKFQPETSNTMLVYFIFSEYLVQNLRFRIEKMSAKIHFWSFSYYSAQFSKLCKTLTMVNHFRKSPCNVHKFHPTSSVVHFGWAVNADFQAWRNVGSGPTLNSIFSRRFSIEGKMPDYSSDCF